MLAISIVVLSSGAAVAYATVLGSPARGGSASASVHDRTTTESGTVGQAATSISAPDTTGASGTSWVRAARPQDDVQPVTTHGAPVAIAAGKSDHGGGGDGHGRGDGHGHGDGHQPGDGKHDSDVEIAISPLSASNPIDTPHTITVTVTDSNGPVVGQFVDFEVSGANAGASGTCVPADCTTDDAGVVTGTYIGTSPGDDTITATIWCNGAMRTATAYKTWTLAPPPPTTTTTTTTSPTTTTTTTTSTTTTTTTTTTAPPTTTTTTSPPPPTGKPPDIFQVELRGCTYLHVGYNRFPDGTLVRWNVTQSGATVSTGQFTAIGGGKKYHFLMLPLGATLVATPKGTAHFHWFANGAKSSYTAGRQPGC